MPDNLPTLTPEEATAAGYLLVDDGSLEDVACKLEISVLELVAIASRPHVQAHLDATRDLALKRAQIKAADARVTAIRTLESIATNTTPPEKLSDHAERIALFHAIERRRAAIALLPRPMRIKPAGKPDENDDKRHSSSRQGFTPWAAISPLPATSPRIRPLSNAAPHSFRLRRLGPPPLQPYRSDDTVSPPTPGNAPAPARANALPSERSSPDAPMPSPLPIAIGSDNGARHPNTTTRPSHARSTSIRPPDTGFR